jgi:hypothetical protein
MNIRKILKILATTTLWLFSLFGFLVASLIFVEFVIYRDVSRDAPTSNSDFRAEVRVSDRGIGWGSDFNADVFMFDAEGLEVARWADSDGRQGDDEVASMIQSMLWVDADTLTFEPRGRGTIILSADEEHSETFPNMKKANKSDMATPRKPSDQF